MEQYRFQGAREGDLPAVIRIIAYALNKRVLDYKQIREVSLEELKDSLFEKVEHKRFYPLKHYLYEITEDKIEREVVYAKLTTKRIRPKTHSNVLILYLEDEQVIEAWQEKGLEAKIRQERNLNLSEQ